MMHQLKCAAIMCAFAAAMYGLMPNQLYVDSSFFIVS